jgi:hypothetical protein
MSIKLLGSLFVALGAIATLHSAHAADPGQLRIQNQSKYFVTYTVAFNDDWWNCNDEPNQGYYIQIAPGKTSEVFRFLRKDGHGCNGKQGQFSMVPSLPTVQAAPQRFWYDSHGGMEIPGDSPRVNYGSQLRDDGNHNYTWIVTTE